MDAHRHDVFTALYRVTSAPAVQPGAADRARRADGRHARIHARAMAYADRRGAGGRRRRRRHAVRGRPRARRRRRSASCLIHNLPGRLVFWRSTEAMRRSIRPRCVRSTCAAPMSKSRETKNYVRPHGAVKGHLDCRHGSLGHRALTRDDIDDVLAIEEAAFTNPWTRAMYLAELENTGGFLLLSRAGREPAARSVSARSGACSTNCTSTTWRCCRNCGARASARRCWQFVLQKGVELGAHRATLEVRRSNEAARLLYERFGFSVAGVRAAYYSKPVEDALVLWREGLSPADRRS